MQTTWNTGAHYTAQGQRISAIAVDKGIVFADLDRGIDGFIPTATVPRDAYALRELTMQNYLYGNYTSAWEHADALRECLLAANNCKDAYRG